MHVAGAYRLGASTLVLAAVAACGPAGEARPVPVVDVAVRSYEAPDGAPGFCTRLASLIELDRLPVSIGTLAAGPDVEARTQVSQAIGELRAVRSAVGAEGGHAGLETALDDLVQALGAVVDGRLTDPARAAVTAGLRSVGEQAQPSCGFPT